MPGMLNTVSVRIAPPSRMPMSRPAAVTIGVIAAAHAVAEDHPPLGEALRARGADVVLVHRLDQVRAQQARVERGERGREHEPRHDQRREPRRRVVAERDVAAGAREDRELADVVGEQVEDDEAEPVDGRRDRRPARRPSRRGRSGCAAVIAEMIPTEMPTASQMTAAPRASEIVAGRRSKICGPDRDVVLVAVAEVEVEMRLLHVVAVLLVQRLVEAEVVADLLDQLRVRAGGRRAASPGRPTGST